MTQDSPAAAIYAYSSVDSDARGRGDLGGTTRTNLRAVPTRPRVDRSGEVWAAEEMTTRGVYSPLVRCLWLALLRPGDLDPIHVEHGRGTGHRPSCYRGSNRPSPPP